MFRLGESIEHTKRKYYVHPPADAEKWAAICVGIVRHYNAGWDHGFHHNIRYWEIWNEPENRPAMWTGTDEQYLDLYVAATKAIKREVPGVCVGGPALGYFGRMTSDVLEPTPFVLAFLKRCKRDAAPLDFFSWHTYTNDPRELVRRAGAVRRLLDQQGFPKTESHLNEWSYLPGNGWEGMMAKDAQVRQRWFDRQSGPEAAAFITATMVLLQDAPLDAANYYSADIQGFGMFTEHGVPKKAFYALKAFKMLADTSLRLAVNGQMPAGVAVAAGIDKSQRQVTILASNFGASEERLRLHVAGLPWRGPTAYQLLLLNAQHDLTPILPRPLVGDITVVEQDVRPASVYVVTLRGRESEPPVKRTLLLLTVVFGGIASRAAAQNSLGSPASTGPPQAELSAALIQFELWQWGDEPASRKRLFDIRDRVKLPGELLPWAGVQFRFRAAVPHDTISCEGHSDTNFERLPQNLRVEMEVILGAL